MKVWQSPPGWPEQPEGWTPPTGWLPDPSWPPAPDDWRFWIERPVDQQTPSSAAGRSILRSWRWLTLATVFVIVAVSLIVLGVSSGNGLDKYATKACTLAAKVNDDNEAGVFDGVVDELTAIHDAESSSEPGLKAAAATTSPASSFDFDNPLYEEPGDVEFAAISSWCKAHV